MNKDEILSGLYTFLIDNIPNGALSLIIENDIRVENFFSIYSGVYLNNLLENNLINNYSFQLISLNKYSYFDSLLLYM
jgi:hypothetical protein